MKAIFLIVLATKLCFSSLAYAEGFTHNQIYAKVFGSVNFLQTEKTAGIQPDFNAGYSILSALGYHWNEGLSFEAEYAFRRNDMSKIHYFGQHFRIPGHFQPSSYMINLLWNFKLWDCFLIPLNPYLGSGIGYDIQQFQASAYGFSEGQEKKGFAWQLMAGLCYPISCRSDITLEYKFHKGPYHNIYSHAIGVGVSYKFF